MIYNFSEFTISNQENVIGGRRRRKGRRKKANYFTGGMCEVLPVDPIVEIQPIMEETPAIIDTPVEIPTIEVSEALGGTIMTSLERPVDVF